MPDPADTTLAAAVDRAANAQRRVIDAAREAAADVKRPPAAPAPTPPAAPAKG